MYRYIISSKNMRKRISVCLIIAVLLACAAYIPVFAEGTEPKAADTAVTSATAAVSATTDAAVSSAKDNTASTAKDAAVSGAVTSAAAGAPETSDAEKPPRPETYTGAELQTYAKETDDGIMYTADGGKITIQGYSGYGGMLAIPSEIHGLPVTAIAASAFYNNDKLLGVTVADSVSEIGAEAFGGCDNLLTAVLGSSVTRLEEGLFTDCVLLNSVILPPSLVYIGDSAFEGCRMLKKLKIPATVEYIGYDAFANCEDLILDCSLSDYAAVYAGENNIETSTFTSWKNIIIIALTSSAVLGAVAFAARKLSGRSIAKGEKPER